MPGTVPRATASAGGGSKLFTAMQARASSMVWKTHIRAFRNPEVCVVASSAVANTPGTVPRTVKVCFDSSNSLGFKDLLLCDVFSLG